MSETTRVQTVDLANIDRVQQACASLSQRTAQAYDFLGVATRRLYQSQNLTGNWVQLPGWHYPVCIMTDGSVHFDNHLGHWGDEARLDDLVHEYRCLGIYEMAAVNGYSAAVLSETEEGTLVEVDVI